MSYNTSTEMATYLTENKLIHDAWTVASTSEQDLARAEAFNIIEALPYNGYRTESGQTDQFPRDGETAIPSAIKIAEAEIAYALLDGRDAESEMRQGEIKYSNFSSIRTTYGSHALWRAYGVPSAVAWKYLTPYVAFGDSIELSKV